MNKVLVIAGGGAMGVGPAAFLDEINKIYPVKPNVFSGTSVGAMLAAMYAYGYSYEEVLKIFEKEVHGIFSKKRLAYTMLKKGAKYDDTYVNKILDKYFKNSKIKDLKHSCFIFAWNGVKKDIKVFDRTDKVPVSYAVRCSMAAPTYFSNVGGYMWDGGLAANFPASNTIAACYNKLGIEFENMSVLGLVTSGRNPDQEKVSPNAFISSTAKVALEAITAGNSSDQAFISRAMIKRFNQVRPYMPNYDLDDTSKLKQVSETWRNAVTIDLIKQLRESDFLDL